MMKGDQPFEPRQGQLPDSLYVLPAHLVEFKLGERFFTSTVKFDNKQYPITSVMHDLNCDL